VDIQRVTVAMPGVVAEAAEGLARITGAEPALRDGDDWVQSDLPGTNVRLAVSGPHGGVTVPTVLLKVASMVDARTELTAAGVVVGEIEQGGHEVRSDVFLPGVTAVKIVMYQPG